MTTSRNGSPRFSSWMKTSEAAQVCRVIPETVIAWAKAGRLRAARTPSGHYRFDPTEVHALINAEPAPRVDEESLETPRAAP